MNLTILIRIIILTHGANVSLSPARIAVEAIQVRRSDRSVALFSGADG